MSAAAAGSTPTPRPRRVFIIIAIALGSIAVLSEPILRGQLSDGRTVDFHLLQLKLAYNTGVAFSVGGQLPTAIVLAVTGSITVGIGIYAWRTVPTSPVAGTVGLAAILAGAVANLIDRTIDGKVTDYFHTGWWPTFNLADTYLTCGVVLLIGSLLFEPSPRPTDTTHNSPQIP